jgi:hypothetical protein
MDEVTLDTCKNVLSSHNNEIFNVCVLRENAVTQHNLHECDVIKILKSNYYSVISSFNYPKIFCE